MPPCERILPSATYPLRLIDVLIYIQSFGLDFDLGYLAAFVPVFIEILVLVIMYKFVFISIIRVRINHFASQAS